MRKFGKSRDGHGGIREILAFLQTLYGLLAGLSLFFPASSALLGALPVDQLAVASSGVVSLALLTSLATVASLFGLLQSVEWVPSLLSASSKYAGRNRAAASTSAAMFFLFGFIFVALFLGGVMLFVRPQSGADVMTVMITLAHPAAFYSFTRAFTMQGLLEYARSKDPSAQVPNRGSTRRKAEPVESVSRANEEESSYPL